MCWYHRKRAEELVPILKSNHFSRLEIPLEHLIGSRNSLHRFSASCYNQDSTSCSIRRLAGSSTQKKKKENKARAPPTWTLSVPVVVGVPAEGSGLGGKLRSLLDGTQRGLLALLAQFLLHLYNKHKIPRLDFSSVARHRRVRVGGGERRRPSEMLDSWNMVSKAWCVSANDGRSEGFHLQPGGEERRRGRRQSTESESRREPPLEAALTHRRS